MHIFISYSRKDIDFAKQIVKALAAKNLDIWIDWKSIPSGADWLTEIERAIETSECFIFLISPDSIISKVCLDELEYAIRIGKRIIPVLGRDIDPQQAPPEILEINWISARPNKDDIDVATKQLVEAINTDYEYLKFHTKLQVMALEWERQKRDSNFLLIGNALEEAEAFLAHSKLKDPGITTIQAQFVVESRLYQDRKKEHQARQRRAILIGVGTGIIIAFCVGGFLAFTIANLLTIPPSWVKMSTGLLLGIVIGAFSFWIPTIISKRTKIQALPKKLSAEEADYLARDTIFISYSRKDWKKFVMPLIDYLREQGFKVWIDQKRLRGGDVWWNEINNAIETCERMILCVSSDSLKSKYVGKEYRAFILSDKELIPLMCRKSKLPFELQDIQYISYDNKDLLVRTLKEYGKDRR
jgi:hypothetical protein